MAGLFPNRGDFSIPTELIDEYQWMADSLIDDTAIGTPCKLFYRQSTVECPNCIQDTSNGRSSGIYKSGGPIEFPNYTVCPYCGGEGKSITQETETIQLRVYWEPKYWINANYLSINLQSPNGIIMVIGYMRDLPRLNKAERMQVTYTQGLNTEWVFEKYSEPVPHGFRKGRYFLQYFKRLGS